MWMEEYRKTLLQLLAALGMTKSFSLTVTYSLRREDQIREILKNGIL